MANALTIEDLHVSYGAIQALQGISLSVEQGEIITLIGANGAGKTTTMNTIMGIVPPKSGSIRLFGQEIAGRDTRDIVKSGCSFTGGPAGISRLSVLDNLSLVETFIKMQKTRKR